MRIQYSSDAPEVLEINDEVRLKHNHRGPNTRYCGGVNSKAIRRVTKIELAGCISFFKAVAENPNTSDAIKAAAKCAAAEDEAHVAAINEEEKQRCMMM